MKRDELEELKRRGTVHYWPHYRSTDNLWGENGGQRFIDKADGCFVVDVDGNRWFDMVSGMWLKNLGHGRKEIADAVYAQMQDIAFVPVGGVPAATVDLAARIGVLAQDKKSRVFFLSGGAEANETALKMARKYHKNRGEPGRWKIISRRGSYHGATLGTMSLGGGGISAPADYGPLMPGNIHIAQVDTLRCVYCKDRSGCSLECARDLERTIMHEGPATVAAFIAEPISVAAGLHIPHPDYWRTIRDICDRHGVLFIADEVITGLGRTGKMFAMEHWGVAPDLFTIAKGLTSGYLPIGAVVASEKVANAFMGDESRAFRHLVTFGGNPVSASAGVAAMKILERENLVQRSAELGTYLFEQLQTLYASPIVGSVRGGLGLLCVVELMKDRETRTPFPPSAGVANKVNNALLKRRIFGREAALIHVAPPLTVTKDEIDHLIVLLAEAIAEVQTQI